MRRQAVARTPSFGDHLNYPKDDLLALLSPNAPRTTFGGHLSLDKGSSDPLHSRRASKPKAEAPTPGGAVDNFDSGERDP